MIDDFHLYLEMNRGRSEQTAQAYARILRRLEGFLEARSLRLDSASLDDIEAFVGVELHQQGVSARSRRPHVAAIRGFYRWAHHRGLISQDPAAGLAYPSTGRSLPHVIQRRELEALLLACPLDEFLGVRDAALISVLAGAGLRVSGLVALNESDLVAQSTESGRDALSLRVREKGGHERMVPLPDEAGLMLRAYLGHPELDHIDRSMPNGDQVVFVSTGNRKIPAWRYAGEHRRLSTAAVWRMIRRRGQRAKIPENALHPHALRHLFATELAEHDVDQNTIATLLGHRDPSTTAVYVHLAQRRLREIVERANPLAHIQTPMTGLAAHLRRRSGTT